jgi:hypothetical protein
MLVLDWKESWSWGVWIVRTQFLYRWTSKALLIYIGFEVLTMVVMKSSVFWHIALCSPLIVDWHGGTCCLHLQGQRVSQKTCSYEMLVDCQTRQHYIPVDRTDLSLGCCYMFMLKLVNFLKQNFLVNMTLLHDVFLLYVTWSLMSVNVFIFFRQKTIFCSCACCHQEGSC